MIKSFDIDQYTIISNKYDEGIGARTKMIVPQKIDFNAFILYRNEVNYV